MGSTKDLFLEVSGYYCCKAMLSIFVQSFCTLQEAWEYTIRVASKYFSTSLYEGMTTLYLNIQRFIWYLYVDMI